MKKIHNKKIFFSVLSLVFASIVCIQSVIAWFVLSNDNKTDSVQMGIEKEKDKSSKDVSFESSNIEDNMDIYPGQEFLIGFSITNSSLFEKKYIIQFDALSVTFPDKKNKDSLLYADSFYYIKDEKKYRYTDASLMNEEDYNSFYEKFIMPVSDSFVFGVAEEEMIPLTEYGTYAKKNETEFYGKTLSIVANSMELTVASQQKNSYTLKIYYKPDFYPTSMEDEQTITLENSNVFVGQKLQLKIEIVDKE